MTALCEHSRPDKFGAIRCKAFDEWRDKQSRREGYEWDKWDGSVEHGVEINEVQCNRLAKKWEEIHRT